MYVYGSNTPINIIDPYGLKDWGQIAGGVIIVGGGIVQSGLGIAIIGVGVAEIESVVGAVFAAHTIGVGGTLIAAGVTSSVLGIDLIQRGWKDGKAIPQQPMVTRPLEPSKMKINHLDFTDCGK